MGQESERACIYQLFVRHFGNTNETRKPNGSILENGCGKFDDISSVALNSIKQMGFTHIWLTGVVEHASGTSYINRPADDAILLKGIAGSPYAITDYFDVCHDYAVNVDTRLDEFKDLLARIRELGLKAIIDFVPNHVARSYGSDIRPEVDFGRGDKTELFFHVDNNFFYLEGEAAVELPDGVYDKEKPARVSGNNVISRKPSRKDWYETVKLNYGHDFRKGANTSELEDLDSVPDTWLKLDQVIEYWQSMGVDGFRCDMAHMVPISFWKWLVARGRDRDEHVYFTGEAYDSDPTKLTEGNVLHQLLDSGFDSVYDSRSYDLVKGIYEEGKWANDLDELLWDHKRLHKMLRYIENHDEVRVASRGNWGDWGASVGKAATAVIMGTGRSGMLLYSGQEVAENAAEAEGFSKADGRSSIFDYWSGEQLCKWTNQLKFDGGRLDQYQQDLRAWYAWWYNLMHEPEFRCGEVFGLNNYNKENTKFGRLEGETVSGHWIYAYLRYTEELISLVVVNLHPEIEWENLTVWLPDQFVKYFKEGENLAIKSLHPCETVVFRTKKCNSTTGLNIV